MIIRMACFDIQCVYLESQSEIVLHFEIRVSLQISFKHISSEEAGIAPRRGRHYILEQTDLEA